MTERRSADSINHWQDFSIDSDDFDESDNENHDNNEHIERNKSSKDVGRYVPRPTASNEHEEEEEEDEEEMSRQSLQRTRTDERMEQPLLEEERGRSTTQQDVVVGYSGRDVAVRRQQLRSVSPYSIKVYVL